MNLMHDCLVDRGQRVYKVSGNHIKFGIEFPSLISKENLKYDQTLICPAGIIKGPDPREKGNIANKNSTNGPY